MNKLTQAPAQAIGAAGVGAAAGVLIVWGLSLAGIDVPGEPATAIGTICTFLAGRFIADQ